MTQEEIVSFLTCRHFKRLEKKLIELALPTLVYIAISKEFRFLEEDLKKALAFQGDDLNDFLKNS